MKKDNQREDVFRAYIAGLIDGEGTIRITKGLDSGRKTYKHLIELTFVNTNKEAVDLIGDFIGGRVYVHEGSKSGFKGSMDCYKTKIVGMQKPIVIIEKLLPYLRIKKPLADLAIEYFKNKKNYEKIFFLKS